MIKNISIVASLIVLNFVATGANAGQPFPLQNSIEITCTDKPVQLGFSGGVIFRATCPGIWSITHQRIDESSFRRRFFSYKHFTFKGFWEIKDQGMIEAVHHSTRELFMVLPGDLIEFKLLEPDCNCKIDITNIGYIKKAGLCELQEWLVYNSYMEKANLSEKRILDSGR
ncbi:MAG: hypothetical protein WC647_19295 [Desulfomonilaceae bacterium]|jgi:hypothetical protein